jgi:hypothetical protein
MVKDAEFYFRGDLSVRRMPCVGRVGVWRAMSQMIKIFKAHAQCVTGASWTYVVCIPCLGSGWLWLGFRSDHWRSKVGGFHIVRFMAMPMDLPTLITLLEQQCGITIIMHERGTLDPDPSPSARPNMSIPPCGNVTYFHVKNMGSQLETWEANLKAAAKTGCWESGHDSPRLRCTVRQGD